MSAINDVTGDGVLAFVPLVLDSTGKFAFSPESLAEAYTYVNGVISTETRGPDQHGNSFRKTYTFNADGTLAGATQWSKV